MGKVDQLEKAAHAAGQIHTHLARVALYGTRYTGNTNAGTAPDRQTIGIAKHSVWQGPTQITSGAPVLRRNQPG